MVDSGVVLIIRDVVSRIMLDVVFQKLCVQLLLLEAQSPTFGIVVQSGLFRPEQGNIGKHIIGCRLFPDKVPVLGSSEDISDVNGVGSQGTANVHSLRIRPVSYRD